MNNAVARRFRHATAEAIRTLGQSLSVDRNGAHHAVHGTKHSNEREILLLHDADVAVGDIVTCTASGETFHLTNIERRVIGDLVTSTTAKYGQ